MQISGEVAFGKMMDSSWWRDHYNYYSYHICENELYNYKRCYFRTKPTERLSVTFGMQAVAVFGARTVTIGAENLYLKTNIRQG